MNENMVLLDTLILTGCYLLMTVALMVAILWIYKLTMRIRKLERKERGKKAT